MTTTNEPDTDAADQMEQAHRTIKAAHYASETLLRVAEALTGDATRRFGLDGNATSLLAVAIACRVAQDALERGAAQLLREDSRVEGTARFHAEVERVAAAISKDAVDVTMEPPVKP